MNVYDSSQIARMLALSGYEVTPFMEQADLIFLNTCSIREKAEQKVYSFLGRLARLKRKNGDLIIAAGGCVAQQEGSKMLQRMPHLDLVVGTHAYHRLPLMIQKIESKKCRIVDVELAETIDEEEPFINPAKDGEDNGVTNFVTIMRGCDNFCAYCVVPYVRGRETSRDPANIIQEVKMLVSNGVREVTLLGQNVNSFGKKEGKALFPELLSRLNEIKGLLRIRFTTSHPKDLSNDLINAFGKLNTLCHHIHLPVQSGSDRILSLMNRKYSCRQYIEKILKLRRVCPDIAITTDIIVGFPGETSDDFKQTLDLIQEVSYDNWFAFKYSDRPQTRAIKLTDKLSEDVKADRLQQVLEKQKKQTFLKNQTLIGTTQTVLVEGTSKREKNRPSEIDCHKVQWSGRTSTNRIVNFLTDNGAGLGDSIFPGALVSVRINEAYANSLFGRAMSVIQDKVELKGENSNAA